MAMDGITNPKRLWNLLGPPPIRFGRHSPVAAQTSTFRWFPRFFTVILCFRARASNKEKDTVE